MNTDLSKVNFTDFNMRECNFAGYECTWLFPKLEGVSWNKDNLIYRSSIWRNSDGKLISAGLKKFFNWLEKPDIYPAPDKLHAKIRCVDKIDGSCLIVSQFGGELITRTRRALTNYHLNGNEVEMMKVKYPKAFNNDWLSSEEYSLIFEWVTPSNRIVLDYPVPELYLTNIVHHKDYSYQTQKELDEIAEEWNVKRPQTFQYSTVEEMLEAVVKGEGFEGRCVYYGNEQHIRKVKSDWYNRIHNFRNDMNLKHIVELYVGDGCPDYKTFTAIMLERYKFEGLQMAMPLISSVCDAHKEAMQIEAGMRSFVNRLEANHSTRKAQAEQIISSYGKTNRADMVFTLLDKKPLSAKQITKLLFQCLIS